MIEVVTPAATTALTTLDRVKMGLGTTDDADDEYLEAMIAEQSDLICAILNVAADAEGQRTLGRETVTETFYPQSYGPRLILSRKPVVSIDDVVNGDDTLDPADFTLDKVNGLLWRGYPMSGWPWLSMTGFAITYTAGYLLPGDDGRTLPYGIESATVAMIAKARAGRGRDPLTKSETIPGVISTEYWVGSTGDDATGLPPDIAMQLSMYRNLGV